VLTAGLSRRFRSYASEHSLQSGDRRFMLAVGTPAPPYEARTIAGGDHSLVDLHGAPSLVGFFSARCSSCRSQLADFVTLAKTVSGGPTHVLAVIAGETDESRYLRDGLADVASVVQEPESGPISKAFEIKAYPTFYVLDEETRVHAAATIVSRLDIQQMSQALGV